MKITPFAISGLLAGVFSLAFGLLVLAKSPNKRIGRMWCLFSTSVSIWGFGVFWIGMCSDPENALWAWRFGYGLGVIWIPTFFLAFICAFCDIRRPKMIALHYLFSIVYFFLMPTNHFFKSPRLMFGSLYFPEHEWPYTIFVAWWIGFVVYSHRELWLAYKKGNPVQQSQIKYFFLATAIGYIGGSLVYLPNFGVELYPWGNFTVFLYPIIMFYAIIRFNLMDIRILFRRTALLVGVYLGLVLLSAPVLYFFHAQAQGHYSLGSQAMQIVIVSLILSAGPFLYAFVVKRNAFFQEYTLAGLTHELKSPLAVIESALDFLNNNRDLKNMAPDQLADYLQMIQRNSSRLQVFVNDLLVAFDPNRSVRLAPKKVDMRGLIERVVEGYRPLAESKNIHLTTDLPTGSTILCDALKIEQTISNLISNALKFSERGVVKVNLQQSQNDAIVSVQDEGPGIPQEELPYIFDRFYQGEAGRSRKGTGIGLTIARLWVEAHGGRIWAESEGEGKGARVTFAVPAGGTID